jgi:hypothetical protein
VFVLAVMMDDGLYFRVLLFSKILARALSTVVAMKLARCR